MALSAWCASSKTTEGEEGKEKKNKVATFHEMVVADGAKNEPHRPGRNPTYEVELEALRASSSLRKSRAASNWA